MFRKQAGWFFVRFVSAFVVEVALACSREGKAGMRMADWRSWIGLDVQEHLHWPVGQAQEVPQLQVHPGPARRD